MGMLALPDWMVLAFLYCIFIKYFIFTARTCSIFFVFKKLYLGSTFITFNIIYTIRTPFQFVYITTFFSISPGFWKVLKLGAVKYGYSVYQFQNSRLIKNLHCSSTFLLWWRNERPLFFNSQYIQIRRKSIQFRT